MATAVIEACPTADLLMAKKKLPPSRRRTDGMEAMCGRCDFIFCGELARDVEALR